MFCPLFEIEVGASTNFDQYKENLIWPDAIVEICRESFFSAMLSIPQWPPAAADILSIAYQGLGFQQAASSD